MQYKYSLDNSSKKHNCPICNKKTFVRYIDNDTKDYLNDNVGMCDRSSNCTHHYTPKQYFSDNADKKPQQCNIIRQFSNKIVFEFKYTEALKNEVKSLDNSIFDKDLKRWYIPTNIISEKVKQFSENNNFRILEYKPSQKPVFIPYDVLQEETLMNYDNNIFINNLLRNIAFPFNHNDVNKAIEMYYLGTINKGYRSGSITFPFIDIDEKIRAVQVKQFDKFNKTTNTTFLHSLIEAENNILPKWLTEYKKNDKKVSCLFGEHLLNKYKTNPIALVEAPKTAIYGTLYFGTPETSTNYLWLAVYNLTSLNIDKCKVLQGREVYLFPDLSKNGKAFELWSNKAKEFEKLLIKTKFVVSDLLEKNATEKERLDGCDLADYLIKLDWKKFRPQEKEIETEEIKELWDLSELKTFFNNRKLPKKTIQLNSNIYITNIKSYVDTMLVFIEYHNGEAEYFEKFKELNQLIKILKKQEQKLNIP